LDGEVEADCFQNEPFNHYYLFPVFGRSLHAQHQFSCKPRNGITYFQVHFRQTSDGVDEVREADAVTDAEDFLRLLDRVMKL
jgi:hypothetical protein